MTGRGQVMAIVFALRASLARVQPGRERRLFLLGSMACLLAACSTGADMGSLLADRPRDGSDPTPPDPRRPEGRKVALLLPLSGRGTGDVAAAMKQAAELALADAGGPGIALLTRDTGGTPEGARRAATEAMAEGVELILGPLLAGEVEAVSPLAAARNINVIAFSSLGSTARPGTFLMSFLPEQEVAAVFRYASGRGYRNIAALYPRSQYGSAIAEAALKYAASYGASVSPAGRYLRETPEASTDLGRIAEALSEGSGGQALFLPEGGESLNRLATALQRLGVDGASVKLLGTGLWDDTVAPTVPLVRGGWYAGVSPDLVSGFERQYVAAYGTKPPRIASLAYDAATLATTLARNGGFTRGAISSPTGFQGRNGLFRFNENGLIERGLAILEMTDRGPRVTAPAPTRFGAAS